MPLPGSLKAQVNTAINSVQTRLATLQGTYQAGNGRYWQGILTPTSIPADGNLVAPDLSQKPTDQVEDWTVTPILASETWPLSVECHVHAGPLGQGYTVYGHVIASTQHWVKAVGVGAHSHTFDWVISKVGR